MGSISHLPRRDRPEPARLNSEQEAETALNRLVQTWRGEPGAMLPQRREALKLSGLTTITLSAEAGGLDCSNGLAGLVVRQIQSIDPGAAEALHQHFVLIEQFRAAGDERFYNQLAEQTLAGDLFFRETKAASGLLHVRQEAFQTAASGNLMLPQAALWADWLWLAGRNDVAGLLIDGAALVPVRSGIYETRFDRNGQPQLAASFNAVPVARSIWGSQPKLGHTSVALDHLLEASRASVRLLALRGDEPFGVAALHLDTAVSALMALVGEAAASLDQAQVVVSGETSIHAADFCLKAALFAADLCGDEGRFERLAQDRTDWVTADQQQ